MALHDELLNDPSGFGYAPFIASGNDGAIYALLNAKTISVNGIIKVNTFAMWAASTGLRSAIEDHSVNAVSPLRSIALTLIDLLSGNLDPHALDLSAAGNVAMLGAWVTAGVITAQQEGDLIALSQTLISRADQLGFDCSIPAIASALRG